jgi:uncharacterized protein YbaP (TraB family)
MKKNKKTLLWKIIFPDKPLEPNYLFGTMHVRDHRAFRGWDYLVESINSCQQFAAEYNLAEGDATLLQEATRLPDNKTLDGILKPKIFKKLTKIVLRETGHDIALFNGSSPMLLHNVLTEAQLGKEENQPLDAKLFETAVALQKKLTGLESFEGQMAVFDQLDLYAQVKSLKDLALNFKKYKKDLHHTVELYLAGDIHQLLKKVKKTAGGMRKVLLYNRNIRMANNFEQIATDGSLFAAIGAGHLAGKKGVLHLLKKKGFTVKPVQYLELV